MKNKIVLAAALLFLQACSESGIEGKWGFYAISGRACGIG